MYGMFTLYLLGFFIRCPKDSLDPENWLGVILRTPKHPCYYTGSNLKPFQDGGSFRSLGVDKW